MANSITGAQLQNWVTSLIAAASKNDTAAIIRLYSKVSSGALPIIDAIGEVAIERAIAEAKKNHFNAAETTLRALSPFNQVEYASHSYIDLTQPDSDAAKENVLQPKIRSYQTFSSPLFEIPRPIQDEIDPIKELTVAVLSKNEARVEHLLSRLVISRITLRKLLEKATEKGISSRNGYHTLAVLLREGPISVKDRDFALMQLEKTREKNEYTERSKQLLNEVSTFGEISDNTPVSECKKEL